MFGRQRDGSLIEEGFITATIVVIISECKKFPVSNRLFLPYLMADFRNCVGLRPVSS